MIDRRRYIKKDGMAAASRWLRDARLQEQIDLAGSRMAYGETLDDLIADGHDVPASLDPNFSWGFFKRVKSHVHHQLHKAVLTRREMPRPNTRRTRGRPRP